jgi:hypothetical protein
VIAGNAAWTLAGIALYVLRRGGGLNVIASASEVSETVIPGRCAASNPDV